MGPSSSGTPTGTSYALLPVRDHHEVWPVEFKAFEMWLGGMYYAAEGRAAPVGALQDAVRTLAAHGRFGEDERPVYRRIAGDLTKMYIDLCDSEWRVVEITAGSWRVLKDSPVAFVRDPGARPLPDPERGGTLDELREHLNVKTDEDWALFRGLILSYVHPLGPYPIGVIRGEAGSAKTSAGIMISRLVDPFVGQFAVGTPKARDVMAAAINAWLIGFDNVSYIKQDLSDVCCALTSGAGVRERQYYSNGGLFTAEARRPIFFSAISPVGTRADFIDRQISPELLVIEPEDRLDEQEVRERFDAAAGRIYGGLLDAIAAALEHLPDTHLAQLPRLASTARFVTAAERGMGWKEGSFVEALRANRGEAMRASIDTSPILGALVELMKRPGTAAPWQGRPSDLFAALADIAPDAASSKSWPRSADRMSKTFKEQAPALREAGLEVTIGERHPGGNRDRYITVERTRDARDARDAS